ncbi:uncharacterized protein LOC106169508 isoform X2 [Lingula anatina]|uniref:Uncharacterized protein LOC106169508 isoform X2 n=1 Tax=Lingula anatina TaxID=7574 RepID=A0A1S3J2B3_LINAN|nr:uncharacterized protein LOC106169508 isoform X2 [Lingula anatina]|eukprot:XP_013404431.1 uncharacterized protein LOC106169508 isoform X2 [Lingula anatina]
MSVSSAPHSVNRKRLLYDVDECNATTSVNGTNNCEHGVCNNLPGSFYCTCDKGYYGPKCSKSCPPIANCQSVTCNPRDGSSSRCLSCLYDDTPAPPFENRGTACRPKCSWKNESHHCFPGVCTGASDPCICSIGFTGDHCLEITQKPAVHDAVVNLRLHSKAVTAVPSASTTTVYTNLEYLNVVQVSWNVSYDAALPPKPGYIEEFSLGLTETKANIVMSLRGGAIVVQNTTIPCKQQNVDGPSLGTLFCDKFASYMWGFVNGDVIDVTITAKNGGFMKVHDYALGLNATVTKYYKGLSIDPLKAQFVFDYVKPFHCYVVGQRNCKSTDMMKVEPQITSTGDFNISWSGWLDTNAGVDSYTVDIYVLMYSEEKKVLVRFSEEPVLSAKFDQYDNSTQFTVDNPGVYSIVMTVTDAAGNSIKTRRFVIYDSASSIDVFANSSLSVDSLNHQPRSSWISSANSLSKNGSTVTVSWKDHFVNRFYFANQFLDEIALFEDNPDPSYDQKFGLRPQQAVPNINGIVKFEVDYKVYGPGYRVDKDAPGDWKTVPGVPENVSVDIPRVEQDTVKIWVRASDLKGNHKVSSITLRVDARPPVIGQASIEAGSVAVKAHDQESGIHRVRYRITDAITGKLIEDNQVDTDNHCNAPTCVCLPAATCKAIVVTMKPDPRRMSAAQNNVSIQVIVYNKARLNATYQLFSVASNQFSKEECSTSWRIDGTHCYPGKCGLNNCTCERGFTGEYCLSIAEKPILIEGEISVVYGQNRAVIEFNDVSNTIALGFTSLKKAQGVVMNWTLTYNHSLPRPPGYIPSVDVGIVESGMLFSIVRGYYELLRGNLTCQTNPSPDKPIHHLNCYGYQHVSWTFHDSDRVQLTAYAQNGGYIDLQPPARSPSIRKYYQGQSIRKQIELRFDFMRPFHCAVSYGCKNLMLDVGGGILKTSDLKLAWSGWVDAASGIANYTYTIYRLHNGSKGLLTEDTSVHNPAFTGVVYPGDRLPVDVKLNDYGLHSVVLKVHDKAGNSILARRFVLYDDVSKHKPEIAAGARVRIIGSNGGWLNAATDVITVDFQGVFVNQFHTDNGFFGRIDGFIPAIEPGYDDREFQNNVAGAKNVDGIVQFKIAFMFFESDSAANVSSPAVWNTLPDPTTQQYNITVPKSARVTRVWVKAVDAMGSDVIDSVTVKVNSVAPTVNAQSVFNGMGRIHLTAQELESGIDRIEWKLFNLTDGALVFGRNFSVPDGTCNPLDCTCHMVKGKCTFVSLFLTPGGATLPNSGLRSEVTVTSNAGISTVSQKMVKSSDLKVASVSPVIQ